MVISTCIPTRNILMIKAIHYMHARNWIILSVLNLLIVGIYGFVMRLKFLFPLPFLDQKNLLHAHSHFAFSGWVTQAIMIFMILMVSGIRITDPIPRKYQAILLANLAGSIGMLITFTWTGYAFLSIAFSFCTVLVSYWFAFVLWKDLNRTNLPRAIGLLFKAALLYSVCSSFGTYALVVLKVTHQMDPLKQLASIYFYLHFQYNGWFLLACLGLASYWVFLKTGKIWLSERFSWTYALTVLPTYFLSVIWWKNFPEWLYGLLLAAVIMQIGLWVIFLFRTVRTINGNKGIQLPHLVKVFWLCVAMAMCFKVLFQLISMHPALSQLVFGFRPFVVAYLHLVLLVIITLFLLGYGWICEGLSSCRTVRMATYGLIAGVVVNELLLGIQGLAGIGHLAIPYTHEGLAIAACSIVICLTVILYQQWKNASKQENKPKVLTK